MYISKPTNICVFILIMLSGLPVLAQQPDPLLKIRNQYYNNELSIDEAVLDQFYLLKRTDFSESEDQFIKCGTPFYSLVHEHAEKLSSQTLTTVSPALSSESSSLAEQIYLSPEGKFRIIYETSGTHAVPAGDENVNLVPDYIEWVADAADSSYRHEVNNLGFTDPIPPGELYTVYVRNLSFIYGETVQASAEPSGTYIRIENDFAGFPPNTDPEGDQKGAIKVTMAHEFKHAIQYAQNNWSGDSDRWAEMDATLMEEVVYDTVNDYYNYIDGSFDDLFSSPSTSLIPGSYEDVTWAIFFHEKFGELFWTDVWDIIEAARSTPFLSAISSELATRGTDYETEVLNNYMWHFASGVKTAPGFGFGEASNYPSPRMSETYSDLQDVLSTEVFLSRLSANYIEYDLSVIRNGFFKFTYSVNSTAVRIGLIIYKTDGSIETAFNQNPILTGLPGQSIEKTFSWSDIEKLGVVVLNTSSTGTANYMIQATEYFAADEITLSQNYPNPFNPRTKIRVEIPYNQYGRIDVYDYTGRYISTIVDGVLEAGVNEYTFNADNLASGIYLYILTTDEGVKYGKMTLIK